ncbi:hypothetical protein PRZ48_014290 [Zasmidium cellare]|uniref:Uncharacterized protein n=1 Tax=Zasmidium cellare TaxID=395010 RepID=A0ABR0E0J2_ZASCE|nr:hypothetical protein PRZ48_014290 [Zasmidium cellare]
MAPAKANSVFNHAGAVEDLTKALQKLSISDVTQDQHAPLQHVEGNHSPQIQTSHRQPAPQQHAERNRNPQLQVSKEKPTLLTLPPELRDIIYEYAFSRYVQIDEKPQSSTAREAALLCTCRQVYQEGLKLYYRNATFTSPYRNPLITWLGKLPSERRKWIRDVLWEHLLDDSYSSDFLAFRFFRHFCKIVHKGTGGDVGRGVLKTCFREFGGKEIWYSSEMISGLGLEEDEKAFKDFRFQLFLTM